MKLGESVVRGLTLGPPTLLPSLPPRLFLDVRISEKPNTREAGAHGGGAPFPAHSPGAGGAEAIKGPPALEDLTSFQRREAEHVVAAPGLPADRALVPSSSCCALELCWGLGL